MARLLFEKIGNAVWISHLDLMRLFQRAFKRAGLPLTHTQGYNPRPSVSIALPLLVGLESNCELLDFDLDGDVRFSCDEIKRRLNDALVAGVRVLEVYEEGRKIRDLALLSCRVELEYDNGVPAGACEAIDALLKRESLIIEKRTKRKELAEVDIAPMILDSVVTAGEKAVHIDLTVQAQNPGLNPQLIEKAIVRELPELAPDFVRIRRKRILDANGKDFR